MKQVAAELVAAQRSRDPSLESKALKAFLDATRSKKNINQHTVPPMPHRLLSKVVYGSSGCWTFIGGIKKDGYGSFEAHGETLAHRASYKTFCGEIPASMHVLHKCDNRPCVNPEHLFLGTHADNMRDMKNKGRSHKPTGSKNPKAKTNIESVKQIRLLFAHGESTQSLSSKFDLSRSNIYKIIRRATWN